MSQSQLHFLTSRASKASHEAIHLSPGAPVNYYYRRNAAQRAKARARLRGRRR